METNYIQAESQDVLENSLTYIWMHFDASRELKRCTRKGFQNRINLNGWTKPTEQEIRSYIDAQLPIYTLV